MTAYQFFTIKMFKLHAVCWCAVLLEDEPGDSAGDCFKKR